MKRSVGHVRVSDARARCEMRTGGALGAHLVLSAVEAVPAAALALHVLLGLAELALGAAYRLGRRPRLPLELDLCGRGRVIVA